MAKQSVFRSESLEKLSSPERLDELLRVIRPQGWLVLWALAIGLLLALTWSFLGRIPITAPGTAILVHPKRVVAFQSPASGRLQRLTVSVGERVEKGQVLGYLHHPELEKALEEERSKLRQFESRSAELLRMERELGAVELAHLQRQAKLLEVRSDAVRKMADSRMQRSQEYIREQRKNVRKALEVSGELGVALKQRLTARRQLLDEQMIPIDQILAAQSMVIENELSLATLEVREYQLNLREELAQETYTGRMDLIKDLEIQRSQLALQELVVERRRRETELNLANTRQEIERTITLLQSRLEGDRQVLSQHTGRVLEITRSEGEEVSIGHRLGKIEIEADQAELMVLAYLSVKDGKQLVPDAEIRVSPTTVQRERFGGILGQVSRVSPFPVTVEAAANQIGDIELARGLLGEEARIEVLARLHTDPSTPTGFRWTSGTGPDKVIVSAGTTASVRVTIEERAPITMVLAFLRSLLDS